MILFAKASNLSVSIQRLNRCEDPLFPFDDLCDIKTKIFMITPSDQLDAPRQAINHLDRRGYTR